MPDGWVNILEFCACPGCGKTNNTTGLLCSRCSVEEKLRNEPDFKKLVTGAIRDFRK